MIRALVAVFILLAVAGAVQGIYGVTLIALGYAVFIYWAGGQLERRDREYLEHPRSAQVREQATETALEKHSAEAAADKL